MSASEPAGRFRSALIAGLDAPVRRFFEHAIVQDAPIATETRLRMSGRIKVGVWLPFTAHERCAARSFEWRAGVGWGRLRPLEVTDRYENGRARMTGRLFGRARLFDDDSQNTVRSAAARAALEAVLWAPTSLLADDVSWHAESDDEIVASWDVTPERPEVRLRIDGSGAIQSSVALRWGNAGRKRFGYIPCGCEVRAERRFDGLVVPSRVAVGWWFGTPRYEPFFHADIDDLRPVKGTAR